MVVRMQIDTAVQFHRQLLQVVANLIPSTCEGTAWQVERGWPIAYTRGPGWLEEYLTSHAAEALRYSRAGCRPGAGNAPGGLLPICCRPIQISERPGFRSAFMSPCTGSVPRRGS